MAWAFWRQPVEGKHALGPAVTGIPSAPGIPPRAVAPVVPPAPVASVVPSVVPPAVGAPVAAVAPDVAVHAPPSVTAAPAPDLAPAEAVAPAVAALSPPAVARGGAASASAVVAPVIPAPAAVAPPPSAATARPTPVEPPRPPADVPLPTTTDELYDEIAAMLVSGDAWADSSQGDVDAVLSALPATGRADVMRRVALLIARRPATQDEPGSPAVEPAASPAAPVATPAVAALGATTAPPTTAAVPAVRPAGPVAERPPVPSAAPPAPHETAAILDPDLLHLLHVEPVHVPEQSSSVDVAGASPSARGALAELAASLAATVEVDAGPQVQLTFRDGTSTSLDPASDAGQALQQLALSLTRRD